MKIPDYFTFLILDTTPTDKTNMAPVGTTGNVDKHVFVQKLNSNDDFLKCHLPEIPKEKEIYMPITEDTIPLPITCTCTNNPSYDKPLSIYDNPSYTSNEDIYY